jgi:uncharacterized protein YbaP (TraB family)
MFPIIEIITSASIVKIQENDKLVIHFINEKDKKKKDALMEELRVNLDSDTLMYIFYVSMLLQMNQYIELSHNTQSFILKYLRFYQNNK